MFGYKPRKVDAVEIIKENGKEYQNDVKKCCHCGSYWKRVIGSGILRGYCTRCNADFCGADCIVCIPHEKQLEMIEAGREAELELMRKGIL